MASELRIIGGRFRGSRLEYSGDPTTRPMKHRVREAIFNLLGTDVLDKHAIDLFAGTGAIGLEAISRGAASATFIERHVPTVRILQTNIQRLGVADRCELLNTSAFLWARQHLSPSSLQPPSDFSLQISSQTDFRWDASRRDVPWVVFCSPPYDFYINRQAEMVELLQRILDASPPESVIVVEADERLDFNLLPTPGQESPEAERRAAPGAWRVRLYPPAQIGILRWAHGDG